MVSDRYIPQPLPDWAKVLAEKDDKITTLRADNERLRAALEKMKRGRDRYRKAWENEKARAAFVAMVEAWPGMHMEDESAPWVPRLILPLPQEARDAER